MYLPRNELRTPKLPYCLILILFLSLSLFITLLSLSSFVLSLSLPLPLPSCLTNQSTTHHPYLGRYLVGDFPPKTLLVVIIRGAAFSSQYAPKNSRLSWTSLRHRGRTAPYRVLGMFGKLLESTWVCKTCASRDIRISFSTPSLCESKMILPPVSGQLAWRRVEVHVCTLCR